MRSMDFTIGAPRTSVRLDRPFVTDANVAPLFSKAWKIVTFDSVKMRKGNRQLLIVPARCHSPEHRERRRLHRLLCVVDKQDHVDIAKPPRDVRRNARRGV